MAHPANTRLGALILLPLLAPLAGCPSNPTSDGGMDATLHDGDATAPTDSSSDSPSDSTPDGGADAAGDGGVRLTISTVDTRFVTREHMLASFEMQQSGEPLAQLFGRNLGGYDRTLKTPDLYTDPANPDAGPVRDLVGYASAIESYEYSKVPMNSLAVESGAGVSLAFGPLVNPTGATGDAAKTLLQTRVQHYAIGSHVGVAGANPATAYVVVPPPADDPNNPLGWRGLWPTMHPFRDFDPAVMPVSGVTGNCSITPGDGDDGRAGAALHPVTDYECNYVSLHLTARDTQVNRAITPGASGWAGWKYSLWITNYLQIMHDVVGNAIATVPAADLANVGSAQNTIVGTTSNPVGANGPGMAGTYLGSSDIEGFQAGIMIDGLDNAAQQWLTALNTTDGATLSGFASVQAALDYDYSAPLRWIPGVVNVTEAADASGFPRPSAYAIGEAGSHLMDLLGLLGAYSQFYALTDTGNADVGGSQPARVYFDGDPFPADNQLADGEATPHDRSLALVKFLLVSLDRLHASPSGVLVDDVTFAGATPARGATVATPSTAYAMVSLRALRRSLGSHLTLYSNSTPDTAVVTTPLDATHWTGAPNGDTPARRITNLLRAQADLLLNHLTDSDGNVVAGWNVTTNAAVTDAAGLESYAAAVRGLLEASLALDDTSYRDRAGRVYQRMESLFYDATLRAYRATQGGDVDFTPLRFALVQSALREMYKLVGSAPGQDALATQLQDRLARLDKLVLNGWDDRNGDGVVQWPDECVRVVDGLPRGGLQMSERALTGELGLDDRRPVSDRDHDCVPESSYAHLPATLASEVRYSVTQ